MKAADRIPWHQLADELSQMCDTLHLDYHVGLCSLCRYAGDENGEVICNHPNEATREKVRENARMNVDCWAFRPYQKTIDDARADMAELLADEAESHQEAAYCEAPDG